MLLSPITQLLSIAYRTGVVGDRPGPIAPDGYGEGSYVLNDLIVLHIRQTDRGRRNLFDRCRVVVCSRALAYYPLLLGPGP